jgi:hypothetical protein
LGIMENNILRIVSRFRPYYFLDGFVPFSFKPRFVLRGCRLELLANVLQPTDDYAAIAKRLEESHPEDFWYRFNERQRVRLGFPYGFALIRYILLLARTLWRAKHWMWRRREFTDLLAAILDEFMRRAHARRLFPIVLFIPDAANLAGGGPDYRRFCDQLRRRWASERALVLDVAEAEFEPRRFQVEPFVGHASAYGNEIIARHIFAALQADPELAAMIEPPDPTREAAIPGTVT